MARKSIREPPQLDPALFEQADAYLLTARELASSRNFLGALEQLSHATSSVRDHPEAILLNACVRAAQGRPEMASKELEKFAGKYPSWPKTGATLGGWVRRDRGQVTGKSQRRWYFLKDKFLFYYREPTDTMPYSGYVVENASIAQNALGEQRDLTQFSFVIPPSVDYTIDALDEKSRAEWISVLTTANLIDPFDKEKKYFADALQTVSSALSEAATSSWSAASSKATSGEQATMEDYLYKRGSTNTDWKTRWFSLRGTLMIYSEREDSKALGSIDVRTCKVRQGEDGDAENPFQLVTPMRTYYLDSETPEATRKWLVAIFNAQDSATKISTEGILLSSSATEGTPYELESTELANNKRNRASVFGLAAGSRASTGTGGNGNGGNGANSGAKKARATTTDGALSSSPSSTSGSPSPPSTTGYSPPSSTGGLKVVTVGRKLGAQDDPKRASSRPRSSGNHGFNSKRSFTSESTPARLSSLKTTADGANLVELTELKPPRDSLVALSALNETEEARRNRAVLDSRRLERTQSEMLNEPLLMNDDLEEDEAAIAGNSNSNWCSGCVIS